MKLLSLCLVLALTVLATSCGRKAVTPLQRKQAANLVSEAQFALTMRDFARAEGLLAQAAELCPDAGSYWISLGATRVRLNKRSAARDAYKRALDAFKDAAAKDKTDVDPMLQQVYVLALLGRADEARSLQGKLQSRFPTNRDVQAFVEEKRLDRMLEDPQFKQTAL